MKKTDRRISIATRISIYFGLLISFLIITVGCSTYARIQQIMELQVREKGEAVASAVTALAAERLQAGDARELVELFSDLEKNEDIGGAALVNSAGKIVAHTETPLIGKTVSDDSPEEIFQKSGSPGPVIEAPIRTVDGSTLGHFYIQMDQGRMKKYMRDLALTMALILLAAVYAGVMLAHIISKRVLRQPIDDLMEATRHIATGNFTYIVPVRRQDELGNLAQAFNAMTSYLTNLLRTVQSATAEMAKSSHLILARTENCNGDEKQEVSEELTEINRAARRLARVVDRLNNLSLQFKIMN